MINASLPVDETFCGKVALHKTNLIQPHGFLLIISNTGSTILQVSENTTDLLQRRLEDIPGTSLEEYLPDHQLKELKEKMFSARESIPFLIDFPGGRHLSMVKLHRDYITLEIENLRDTPQGADNYFKVFQDLKFFSAALDNTSSTAEVCEMAIQELKRISGFDKIMIYQFDQYWNGDVIAEVMEEGMDSYLGLKFPASDIPAQARELYRQMPFRLIPNIDYEPVKLYPVLNPQTGTFTDLSQVNLRSVAAVHLEYLRNMQVCASMSTRILQNNMLWGLIACHHRTPLYLSYERCMLFELVSSLLSARIAAMQLRDAAAGKEKKLDLHRKVIEALYKNESLAKLDETVLTLLNVDGLAIVQQYAITTVGLTPAAADIDELVFWLQTINIQQNYAEVALAEQFEPAAGYPHMLCGLLAMPVDADKRYYLLAFRQEVVQKLSWSGNPSDAVQFEPDGIRYHPRASFGIWQQTVTGRSQEWSKEDLETAEKFRNAVVEFVLNKIEKD